jgi:lactate racemase
VPRAPLLSGSRILSVTLPDDAALLSAPGPLDPITDVHSAVAEALRFPLSGQPLDVLATRGGRATVVVDTPVLPIPDVRDDPRQTALAATLDELTRAGISPERQTVLVAGGLERRAGRRELETLLSPVRARDFRGSVLVHDVEDESLRPLEGAARTRWVASALVETDLVVVVSAAETILHGGPAALLGTCGPNEPRAAGTESLLEPAGSPGWALATSLEALLARHVPLIGVSLVLDHPRPVGRYRGWPWEVETVTRLARSRIRRLHNASPSGLRHWTLRGIDRRLDVFGALAGPPSVAHAEALLRGTTLKGAALAAPVETIVVPLPWETQRQPRAALDPISVACVGLGLALRLWRERSPLAPGGTVVLLHHLRASFGRATAAPYRALYEAMREPDPEQLALAESRLAHDRAAIDAYRAGRAPHPVLPFADWAACAPVLAHAGRVIVGGCRDAVAAKRLGFIPSHSPQAALEMAAGLAGEDARLGVLLAPPYPPIVVG